MEVLKDSGKKFVSAVGISLLTSGSVFGLLTAPGVIVLYLGRKKLPADFQPAKWILLVFLDAAGREGLGSFFFCFLVVP